MLISKSVSGAGITGLNSVEGSDSIATIWSDMTTQQVCTLMNSPFTTVCREGSSSADTSTGRLRCHGHRHWISRVGNL